MTAGRRGSWWLTVAQLAWIAGAVGALVLPAVPAAADGVGVVAYRWVYPPKYLRATNIPPAGTIQTVSLADRSEMFVSPSDAQASVDYVYGAFGFPKGQRSIEIGIHPLRHYRRPRRGRLVLDGNVYGMSYHFLPSGASPARSVMKIYIGLASPHTPVDMVGLVRGRWRVLCGQSIMLYTQSSTTCETRVLAPQVAFLYRHFGPFLPSRKPNGSGLPIPIIIAIVIVVLWAAIVVFLITRRWGPVERGRRRG